MHLRYYPDPVLQKRAEPVDVFDEALEAGARRMFELMYEHGGIGLAGPQVGWSRRIFVVNLTADPGSPADELVFINPVIRQPQGDSRAEEGCLSFPDIRGDVERTDWIRCQYQDIDGNPHELECNG